MRTLSMERGLPFWQSSAWCLKTSQFKVSFGPFNLTSCLKTILKIQHKALHTNEAVLLNSDLCFDHQITKAVQSCFLQKTYIACLQPRDSDEGQEVKSRYGRHTGKCVYASHQIWHCYKNTTLPIHFQRDPLWSRCDDWQHNQRHL